MVGECYNDMSCGDYPVSCSVCSCVLDEPVVWQRAVWRHVSCVSRLHVDCMMFLTPRVYGFHLLTGVRTWTYMWF